MSFPALRSAIAAPVIDAAPVMLSNPLEDCEILNVKTNVLTRNASNENKKNFCTNTRVFFAMQQSCSL